MQTTDLHVAVLPYDDYADSGNDTFGLARTAAVIDATRAEATNSLLVDNGDAIQGNNALSYYTAIKKGLKAGDIHPVFKAMNMLDYTVSTLGNHEFNFGLDFLASAIAGANFPFVSANITKGTVIGADPTKDPLLVKPYIIVDRQLVDGAGNRQRIRIGFIGFLPSGTVVENASYLEGKVIPRDIIAAAQAWVPQMKEDGADLIVALSHSGIDTSGLTERMENASLYLAGVPGIDVVFAGHHHRVFPDRGPRPAYPDGNGVDNKAGTLQGKPAVMAGYWGSHLGLIDLLLEKQGDRWAIISSTSEARPIYRRDGPKIVPLVESKPSIVAMMQPDIEEVKSYLGGTIGTASQPLHSYFAIVAGDPTLQVVSRAQSWFMKNRLAGSRWRGLPMLSAVAPVKAGERYGPDFYVDVPAGPITIRNVADIYGWSTEIHAVEVSGAVVREWLEMSASVFNRIEPGRSDEPLFNADFRIYNFDVIDGVTYEIDLAQKARYDNDGALVARDAHRVANLEFQNRPIDPERSFIVVTNNFRTNGGGHFPGIGRDRIVVRASELTRDAIVGYITDRGVVEPVADGNWSFKPLPGTSVIFESSPNAKQYAAAIKARTIEEAGETDKGFVKYRLFLD